LGSRQQYVAADVFQGELQRIDQDLLHLELVYCAFFLLLDGDHLDLQLVERLVEVVDLTRVEVELVECERDLVRGQRSRFASGLEQVPGLLGLKYRYVSPGDRRRSAHCATPPVKADKLAGVPSNAPA